MIMCLKVVDVYQSQHLKSSPTGLSADNSVHHYFLVEEFLQLKHFNRKMCVI